MEERTCRGCPRVVPPSKGRKPRSWCSETCRVDYWRSQNPDKVARLTADSVRRQQERSREMRRACTICGVMGSRANTATCGKSECLRVLRRSFNRQAYEANPERGRARVAAYRAARTPEQVERDKARRIEWAKAAGYYESKRAADARRRARKRAVPTESFTHREIFDRDGWRCGICGKRINPRLKRPNLKSVSLDHVIPLSHGGPHTRANVRASHLDCNIRRGAARTGADQLALI